MISASENQVFNFFEFVSSYLSSFLVFFCFRRLAVNFLLCFLHFSLEQKNESFWTIFFSGTRLKLEKGPTWLLLPSVFQKLCSKTLITKLNFSALLSNSSIVTRVDKIRHDSMAKNFIIFSSPPNKVTIHARRCCSLSRWVGGVPSSQMRCVWLETAENRD